MPVVRKNSTPYYTKTRPKRFSGRSVTVIEQSAQAASTLDRPNAICQTWTGHDQHVSDALMISLGVIMRDELPDGGPQRIFAEQNHSVQTAFLNTADEPLSVAVQVW